VLKKLLLVGLLLVLAVGALAWVGLNKRTDGSVELLRAHPVIVELLGGIDSASADFIASADREGDGIVIDLKGPKANGRVTLDLIVPELDVVGFRSGSLELESGEVIDLGAVDP